MASDAGDDDAGLLAPLAKPVFASLWVAGMVSSIGTAMQGVAATWLVVASDPRPATVALLQAASSAPLFLVGLPAGVLADIVDRRKLLIAANLWMALAAGMLAVATFAGAASVETILAATFMIGLGAAAAAPAFQAIVPELAEGPLLAPAVTLNSVGMNIARTVGPALGGVAVAALGGAAVFALNAVSTLGVVAALVLWRRVAEPRRLPPEHFLSATRASLRYVEFAPDVRRVLLRAAAFFLVTSAAWALLPVIAAQRLHLGATGYGTLLGALGVGAVFTALGIGRLKALLGPDRLVAIGTGLCGFSTVALGFVEREEVALAVLAGFGAGWIIVLTLLNVAVQASVAGWIRARMLAVYVVVYFGAFAGGSLIWGQVANGVGMTATLEIAGGLGVLLMGALLLPPTRPDAVPDLTPAASQEPVLMHAGENDPGARDEGAVLVSIDYRVAQADAPRFEVALVALRASRRRSGALAWRYWRDPDDAELHREAYLVESWIEYQRQQLRRTVSDAALDDAAASLASGTPVVRLLRERRVT